MKKLYVGNLSYQTRDADLEALFADYNPTSVRILTDRETGRSRGFGFVEIDDDASADAAISALDGQDFQGRDLKVSEAQPQESGRGGGGGGFRGGNRGGHGGGGGGGERRGGHGGGGGGGGFRGGNRGNGGGNRY